MLATDSIERRSTERLSFARLDDVWRWGWTGEELLKRLIAFDRQVVGHHLTEERQGTVPQWAPVFLNHPETWALLTRGPKNIIGYWHFAALNDEEFARLKCGELQESEITLDSVEALDTPGVYNLYFTLLGSLPDCPGGGARLMNAFYNQLDTLSKQGVFFREICANVFTDDGRRICEGIGMERLCDHQDFGIVYSLPMEPWPMRYKQKRWDDMSARYLKALSRDVSGGYLPLIASQRRNPAFAG